MKTIYEAKNFIHSHLNKKVIVKVIGIRNKNEMVEGVISECYANIFMIDTGYGKKSYTYTDVLIGNVLVKIK